MRIKAAWRCLVGKSYKPQQAMTANVIVALAFGNRKSPKKDKINKALAHVVERELARTGAFVVAQHEIGDHLRLGQTDDNKQMFVVRKNRNPDEDYIDTKEVLAQAWDEMKKLRPNLPELETIIVAHKDHIWRVVETALAIGFKVVGVADTRRIGYDWWSKRLWTKFRFLFVPYERLARLIYLRRGWILKPNPDD